MFELPSPGPGRPQHSSYSVPAEPMSWRELAFWAVAIPALGALLELFT